MGIKKLMSIEDAARCAMAPTEEYVVGYSDQPEQALRNGHNEAAHDAAGQPRTGYLHLDSMAHWLRDTFGPVRGGGAAA